MLLLAGTSVACLPLGAIQGSRQHSRHLPLQELARTSGSLSLAREQVELLQKEREELKSRWAVHGEGQAGRQHKMSRLMRLPCMD